MQSKNPGNFLVQVCLESYISEVLYLGGIILWYARVMSYNSWVYELR